MKLLILVIVCGCSSTYQNGLFDPYEIKDSGSDIIDSSIESIESDIDRTPLNQWCNNILCDEKTSCNLTCTVNGTVMYCRNFNKLGYSWYSQAICGTHQYPFGTQYDCEGVFHGLCCIKTINWSTNC